MFAQFPPTLPPAGVSAAPRRELTVVLVDARWEVERWVVGAGPAAREWDVVGASFWELTDGRIADDGRAELRDAMDDRLPDVLALVDPLGQETVQTIVTPTTSGLAIVFQPAVDDADRTAGHPSGESAAESAA